MYYLVWQNNRPVAAFCRKADLVNWKASMRYTLNSYRIATSNKYPQSKVHIDKEFQGFCYKVPLVLQGPLYVEIWPPASDKSQWPLVADVPVQSH